MRLAIFLVFLSSCRANFEEGWAQAHGYELIGPGVEAHTPTIGPSVCRFNYRGKYFKAVRYPIPEERCGNGTRVLLLVCCDDAGNCYGSERDKSCSGVLAGE